MVWKKEPSIERRALTEAILQALVTLSMAEWARVVAVQCVDCAAATIGLEEDWVMQSVSNLLHA